MILPCIYHPVWFYRKSHVEGKTVRLKYFGSHGENYLQQLYYEFPAAGSLYRNRMICTRGVSEVNTVKMSRWLRTFRHALLRGLDMNKAAKPLQSRTVSKASFHHVKHSTSKVHGVHSPFHFLSTWACMFPQ